MPVVAVAGGTSSIGRSIVEAIVETGKHEVIVLSRKPNPELEDVLKVRFIAVDYFDHEGLVECLEDNKIHTLISAMTFKPTNGAIPEVQLLTAADASKVTRRYVFNNWGCPLEDGDELRMPVQAFKVEALKALHQTKDLEHTQFYPGFFTDYWCMPAVKSHIEAAAYVVDIPNSTAVIPGDGTTPVGFTHTLDVAKYVAAALDLEKWESEYNIVADKKTWNEFLPLFEDARGTKFKVTYDSIESLKAGNPTPLPAQAEAGLFAEGSPFPQLMCFALVLLVNGKFDVKRGRAAKEAFPDIHARTVKELMDLAWKKT
ncbi:NAD(P)-binding protein [Xylariaceae sp. FL1019]|nr:NAD(P)-binding protein [Xylariaceae sp. FL1019]